MDKNARKVRNQDINPCIESKTIFVLFGLASKLVMIYAPCFNLLEKKIWKDIRESDGSQKCMDANSYDKNMCSAYFLRYKNCRKYWHNIMLERRRDGVKPDMPTAEERQQILTSIGGKPY